MLQGLRNLAFRIELKLANVYLGLVSGAKIDDFLSFKEQLELFLPLHRVVVLQTLLRYRVLFAFEFLRLQKLLEHELEFLQQARSRELRGSVR